MDSTTPHRQLPAPLVLTRTLDFDRFNSELDGFASDPYMRNGILKTPNIRTDPTKEPKPHGHGQQNRKRKSASSSSDFENKENGGSLCPSPKSSKTSHDSLASKLHLVAQVKQLREENERLEEEGRKLRAENFTYRQYKESEVLNEFLQIATACGKDSLLEKDAVVFNYGGEGDLVLNANPDFVFSGPTNPLEIDLILMNVMKFLKPIDLQKCRLVSKTFNHFASKELSKSHSHVFISNSSTALRFTKLMQDTSGFPYSKLLLKNKCVNRMRVYLNSFGSHIKTLKIIVSTRLMGPDVINFENISNILSLTPNLEELELIGLNYPQIAAGAPALLPLPLLPFLTRLKLEKEGNLLSSGRNESAYTLLTRLFTSTPSLTNLSSSSLSHVSEYLIRAVSGVGQLKELYFDNCIEEYGGVSLSVLASAGFRLRACRIQLHVRDGAGVKEFLGRQAGSLEELELKISSYQANRITPTFVFPKFRVLKSLKLIGYVDARYDEFPISRTAVENTEFPALKTLTLSDAFFTAFTVTPTPSVTALVVNPLARKFSYALGHLVRRDEGLRSPFPNLISLHLHNPAEEELEAVFSSCPFLHELIIELTKTRHGTEFSIERGLTGLKDSGWLGNEIKDLDSQNKIIQFSVLEFLRGVARKKKTRLCNLSNLKRLQIINNEPLYGCNKVGDLAGYLSLLEIHKLDYLYIREGKLSESCIKALKSYHNVVVIDTIPPPAKN